MWFVFVLPVDRSVLEVVVCGKINQQPVQPGLASLQACLLATLPGVYLFSISLIVTQHLFGEAVWGFLNWG